MDRARLLAGLAGAGIQPGDAVFIERRGEGYLWSRRPPGEVAALAPYEPPGPDAWIVYSGPWPADRLEGLFPFLEDLLADMESMGAGADRCRWPLDEPYPPGH